MHEQHRALGAMGDTLADASERPDAMQSTGTDDDQVCVE
jgi:hypothetical protein